MDLILVGPGRAGLSLALASVRAGHRIAGVLGRTDEAADAAAGRLDSVALRPGDPLPAADLLVIAVRDDDIPEVVEDLGVSGDLGGAVHLSGMRSIRVLEPIGVPIGSFHPLQTLPDPDRGSERLAGAWVAVTTDDDLFADRLFGFAADLGMHPFELQDDQKALYHAGAAAAANFTLANLALANRLLEAAGVDATVAGPLVRAVTDNALAMGPEAALTGPVARGDVGTVRAQIEAVRASMPDMAEHFEAMVRATAAIAGTTEAISEALR